MALPRFGPLAVYDTATGNLLFLAVCTKESHTRPVTFTTNPVETGAPVTDHARPEPWALAVDVMASLTPLDLTDNGENYTGSNELWQVLGDLQTNPRIVDIITIGGLYLNMGVRSVTRSIDAQSANGVKASLDAVQIRVVQNKFARIVVAKDTRAQPNRKKGGTQTKPLAPADNRTAAAKLADGLAGRRVAP